MDAATANIPQRRDGLLGPVRRTDLIGTVWLTDLIGPASLIACPVVMVAYLALAHGLDPLTGARGVVGLYVLGVIPGYLAQRFVFGLRSGRPFETLLSSLLLGTLLTPLVWHALCWVGAGWVFWLLAFSAAVVVPITCGWHRQTADRLRRLVAPVDVPMLWMALGMVVLWGLAVSPVRVEGDRVLITANTDHVLHMMLVGELARGVPAETVPFIAGASKWAYHHMPDVWADLIRRIAGTDARTAYFFLALPLRYLFVSLACYLAVVRRFGRPAALTSVFCMLAFVGYPGRALLDNWLLTYLFHSYPTTFGLMGVFLILYYVSILDAVGTRAPLLLASTLSVVLLWYKANFALAVTPAVTVLCLVVLARRRDYRWLGLCLAVQAMLAGVRWLDVSTADMHGMFVIKPLAFVDWWWGTLAAFTWWGSTLTSTLINGTVIPTIEALPSLLAYPAKFALLVLRKFHLGLLVVPYLVHYCGFARPWRRVNAFDALMLLILLVCAMGFVVFPVDRTQVWNVSMHVLFLVDAVLLVLAGPVVVDVVRRLSARGRLATAATSVALLAAFVYNASLLHGGTFRAIRHGREISPGLYACCRYVESATPPDAVVLHPMFRDVHHAPSLLTQRRTVLDNGHLYRSCYDTEAIMADIDEFYGGADATSARVILARYNVDYVIADGSVANLHADASVLTPVFQRGDVTVYRVEKELDLAAAL